MFQFGFDPGNIDQLMPWWEERITISKKAMEWVAKSVATVFLERLKSNWYHQTAGLAPLAESYRHAKEQKGLDTRILIATGALVERLQVYRVPTGKKKSGVMMVGIKPGKIHPTSGLDYAVLMKIMEYGSPSRHIPARPIFMITRLQLERELRSLTEKKVKEVLAAGGSVPSGGG